MACGVDDAAVSGTGHLYDWRDGDERDQCWLGYGDCCPGANGRCVYRQSDVWGCEEGAMSLETSGWWMPVWGR